MVEAHPYVATVAIEASRGQVAVRKPVVNDLPRLDSRLHREQDPRGEDRIQKRRGVTHDHPAVSRQARAEVLAQAIK